MERDQNISFSQVFGAFLSTDVSERRRNVAQELRYFGTGECFVFTVRHIFTYNYLGFIDNASSYSSCEKSKVYWEFIRRHLLPPVASSRYGTIPAAHGQHHDQTSFPSESPS